MGRHRDHEIVEYRLRVWRELCRRGWRVDDIAEHLNMKRDALDQFLYRERKAGNPAAIYHPDACFVNPNPSARQLAKRIAARRRDRRRTAARREERAAA